MKILIIPSWYPNKSDPLWGNYFIKQAIALNDYADVSMLYINRVGLREKSNYMAEKKTDGFNDTLYPFKFYKKSILNYKAISLDYSYKRYIKEAYKAYKKFVLYTGKPDVILVESALPAGLAAKYIKEKEGIPYMVHSHAEDVIINSYYKDYTKDIILNADASLAVNEVIKGRLMDIRNDIKLIPNFIDCKKFDKKLVKDKKDFNLINICNFYKVKSLDVLLKALNIVVNEKGYKNVKLKIVGTGEYKDLYISISNSLNLKNNVEFLGYVDNDLVPDLLSKSNVLCVSSSVETFCIPIVEAFSTGIPVISTACVGPKEIVNKDNGVIVPIGDVEKYADAIINMIKNYKKYDSKKIKKYAYDNYDKSVICKKIIEIAKDIS